MPRIFKVSVDGNERGRKVAVAPFVQIGKRRGVPGHRPFGSETLVLAVLYPPLDHGLGRNLGFRRRGHGEKIGRDGNGFRLKIRHALL